MGIIRKSYLRHERKLKKKLFGPHGVFRVIPYGAGIDFSRQNLTSKNGTF